MPYRDEFDIEYDNDAELVLSELVFSSTDTKEEIEIKEGMLMSYNEKLKERRRRKFFLKEYNLVNLNEVLRKEKMMSAEERRLHI